MGAILCRLFGHAWREERRWSMPHGCSEIIETAVSRQSGSMFAAMAMAQGMSMRVSGRNCVRCEAHEAIR